MPLVRLAAVAAMSLALGAAAAAQPAPAQLTITVWSFGFAPRPIHLAAGRPVTLVFVNRSGSSPDFTAGGAFWPPAESRRGQRLGKQPRVHGGRLLCPFDGHRGLGAGRRDRASRPRDQKHHARPARRRLSGALQPLSTQAVRDDRYSRRELSPRAAAQTTCSLWP